MSKIAFVFLLVLASCFNRTAYVNSTDKNEEVLKYVETFVNLNQENSICMILSEKYCNSCFISSLEHIKSVKYGEITIIINSFNPSEMTKKIALSLQNNGVKVIWDKKVLGERANIGLARPILITIKDKKTNIIYIDDASEIFEYTTE